MKQPLHKLISPSEAIKALRPEYKTCPFCGVELHWRTLRSLLAGHKPHCLECCRGFTWKQGTPWINRQVEPSQAAAFLAASQLTEDKEAIARAAGVSVDSVRLWLRAEEDPR